MDDCGRVIIDLEELAKEGLEPEANETEYLRKQDAAARLAEVRRLKCQAEAAEIRSRKRIALHLKKMRQGDM